MNILGKRYWLFLFSFLIIAPGLIILAVKGAPLSIDFKGGSMLEVSFASGKTPETEIVRNVYAEFGITDLQVQTSGADVISVRSPFIEEATRSEIVTRLEAVTSDKITIRTFDSVGPSVSTEVAQRAAVAVAISSLAVIIYITFAFRGMQNAFRYGVCAILALVHDILLVISVMMVGTAFFGWQMDLLFLTALLTVIGFSVQDTIVVFDRVRENASIYRRLAYEPLVNHSIVQTLQRSINTQLMTGEFMLLALALFGGDTLRGFCVVLLVGLLSGTYSSIFVAASILIVWEQKEWKTWFKRTPKTVTN